MQDGRQVYLNGELVDDVTTSGAYRNAVAAVMANEILVTSIQPLQPDESRYAISFVAPMNLPGPYTEMISAKACQRGIYIAANMMEVHPDFPGRFFNTSFLISPQGAILIKHWKNNNNAWVFPYTTPSDIYSEFVARFGREALFPLSRTEIGNIGLLTCGELGFPENARCTMMNGAEILLHLSSEPNNMSHGDVRNWE